MNKIMLIGHLGKDPDMSYTPSGTAVTKFSLAVRKRPTKSQTAENGPKDDTDWFNIVAWDKLAETCNSYLHKGSKIFAEGRLSMRKYIDKDNIQRTAIEVIINEMEMLTPPKSAQQSGGSNDNFLGDDGGLGDLDDHPF